MTAFDVTPQALNPLTGHIDAFFNIFMNNDWNLLNIHIRILEVAVERVELALTEDNLSYYFD